jgi:hypothetical protein
VKKAPGQVQHLTIEALAGLKERLATGAPFKSYGEIVEWLKTEYNLELTYAQSMPGCITVSKQN